MTASAIVQLALGLLQMVLSNFKGSGVTVAEEVTQGIQAAISSLEAVQNTPVTYQQLESLRIEPKW